jgi:hypothetical protein
MNVGRRFNAGLNSGRPYAAGVDQAIFVRRGACSRDATVNRLIVDSVKYGVRQQYPDCRNPTFNAG